MIGVKTIEYYRPKFWECKREKDCLPEYVSGFLDKEKLANYISENHKIELNSFYDFTSNPCFFKINFTDSCEDCNIVKRLAKKILIKETKDIKVEKINYFEFSLDKDEMTITSENNFDVVKYRVPVYVNFICEEITIYKEQKKEGQNYVALKTKTKLLFEKRCRIYERKGKYSTIENPEDWSKPYLPYYTGDNVFIEKTDVLLHN